MPTTYITSNITGPDARKSSTLSDADLFVAENVLVGDGSGTALSYTGADLDMYIHGMVQGATNGIRFGGTFSASLNTLRIYEGASVTGGSEAIVLARPTRLWNAGEIHGGDEGISLEYTSVTRTFIVNTGTITAEDRVIEVNGDATVRLTNLGLIATGATVAYWGGDLEDVLVNHGTILGDVTLNDGDDTYDGRGGTIQSTLGNETFGVVSGNDGSDTFLPGGSDEAIDGGAGRDTLDFRGSGGLRVSLVDNSGTGRAEGDIYTGIERVLGSRGGRDTLIGDGAANTLEGFGGTDALQGAGGTDRLIGGPGIDRLTGGSANDIFEFSAPGHGGDRILDFGGSDSIHIDASGFGGGLFAGAELTDAQFDAQLTNVAKTNAVRFIWETDVTKLWFDRNGKDAGCSSSQTCRKERR